MVETEFFPEHQAPHVIVGNCDSGPLSFSFQNNTTPSIWTDYSQMVNTSRLRWNFVCWTIFSIIMKFDIQKYMIWILLF